MRRNRVRYVLIIPCCVLLVVVIRGIFDEEIALGPTFSSQVWSISWLASVCPKTRFSFGVNR